METRRTRHWLDYANIFIRYITRPSWRKALSEITVQTLDRALEAYFHSAAPTGLIPFIRGIHENLRFEERETNKRMNERKNLIDGLSLSKEEKGRSRERVLSQTFRSIASIALFEESRVKNSSPTYSSRRLAGNYQWHPASNSANDCRHTSPFDG